MLRYRVAHSIWMSEPLPLDNLDRRLGGAVPPAI